ncbi:unnamed protein product, partial [Discosporangium mesarthrocarpum]
KVVNITSPDEDGTYATGDVITVLVTYDRHVMVIGSPTLHLNTGRMEPGRASYEGGSGNKVL